MLGHIVFYTPPGCIIHVIVYGNDALEVVLGTISMATCHKWEWALMFRQACMAFELGSMSGFTSLSFNFITNKLGLPMNTEQAILLR